jgi:hypothetical protein
VDDIILSGMDNSIMRRGVALVLMLILISAALPLISEEKMDLVTSPECYQKGGNLILYINLPIELIMGISEYQLKILITGTGLSINEVLTGDQLTIYALDKEKIDTIPELQKAGFNANNVIAFPVSIDENTSGNLIINLELVASGKTVSLLRTFISEESISPSITMTGLDQKKSDPLPASGVAAVKDYRERFIYGNITVKEVEWPDFVLILKAEKVLGGGVEKAYIKISQAGTYGYRLGNLYPGEYIFETLNLETDVNFTRVVFGADDLSRKIDIQIPRIAPVNLRLYNLETESRSTTDDGIYSYHLKAYVCRFDDSVARNLFFNWQCGDIYYYNTPAPEKGRCVPLIPAPIMLKMNEQTSIELIVNPPLKKKLPEFAAPELFEADRSDNKLKMTLSGGN